MGAQVRLICFTPFRQCLHRQTDSLPPVPVEHWAALAPQVCGWGSASALQLLPDALETNRETWACVLSSFLFLLFATQSAVYQVSRWEGRMRRKEERKEREEWVYKVQEIYFETKCESRTCWGSYWAHLCLLPLCGVQQEVTLPHREQLQEPAVTSGFHWGVWTLEPDNVCFLLLEHESKF